MKIRYYVPAIVWALVILLATTIPASSIPVALRLGIKDLDKFIHFFLFAVFGALLAFALFKQQQKFWHNNYIWLSLIFGLLFGALTEGLQFLFISSRSGNLIDLAFNFFGTVFGVLFFRGISSFFSKNFLKKK
jgi:VanZ family protein